MPIKRKRSMKARMKKAVDEHAKNELDLFIENQSGMYPMKQAIIKNLALKRAKGKYDPAKAPKAWQYWVDRGAKEYTKEFGVSGDRIFDKTTRTALAEDLAKRYERGE